MRCGVVRNTAHAHPSNLLSKGHGTPLSGTYTHTRINTHAHTQGHKETNVRVCTHAATHAEHTHTTKRVREKHCQCCC